MNAPDDRRVETSNGTPNRHRTAVVAGVPVDDVTMGETVRLVESFIAVGRATGRTFQIATVNVDFVVNAQKMPDVLSILQRAELCVPDGMPILWHSRLRGVALRERVPGADLVPALVEQSVQCGWRILFFGSTEGVAESAARLLEQRYPGAVVQGISGPMLADVTHMEQRWTDAIVAFAPDIICVALGNPKQERWIEAHRATLGASVLIGVGGTLDFLVGGRRRAPRWMQRSGLEWLYRAAQEPGRLGRRYTHDALVFGPHLMRAGRARVAGRMTTSSAWTISDGATGHPITVDMGNQPLRELDGDRLTGLARQAHRSGSTVVITGVPPVSVDIVRSADPHGTFRGPETARVPFPGSAQ